MSTNILWWDALNIQERTALDGTMTLDAESGAQAIKRWGSLPAFRDNRAAALEVLGHTETTFLHLLSETSQSLAGRAHEVPQWFDYFTQILALGREATPLEEQPDSALGLLAYLGPALRGAQLHLENSLNAVALLDDFGLRNNDTIRNAVLGSLPFDQLSQMATRVAVLHMHRTKADAGLVGADSTLRYESFVRSLEDTDVQDQLFGEYPVLVRAVAEKLQLWEESRLEFYTRLRTDLNELIDHGLLTHDDLIKHVHFGAGDTHQRGRTVTVVESESGGFVYKPRSGLGDSAFQHLVDRTNALVPQLALDHPQVIDKGIYSWHRRIIAQPIDDSNVGHCARSLGALTALLSMLQSNDFHHENIVFAGATPYAIDTETLFHTELSMATEDQFDARFSVKRYRDSVATVGVLPSKTVTAHEDEVFTTDISAMGYTPGQRSMLKIPTVTGVGTDEMTFSTGYATEPLDESFTPHNLIHHGEHFARGFEEVYAAWEANLDELIGAGGILEKFAQFEAREIPRPTMVYAKVLMESYHPDFMRDGRDRDLVLSKLLKGYEAKPHRVAMLRAEIQSLRLGDIPFFTKKVSVAHSQALSAIDHVKARLQARFAPAQQAFELSNIEFSLIAAGAQPFNSLDVPRPPSRPDGKSTAKEVRDQALQASRKLTSYLSAIAPTDSEGVPAWLTLSVVPGDQWTVSPTAIDFYAGVTGIHSAIAGVSELLNTAEHHTLLDGIELEIQRFEAIMRQGLHDESLFKDQIDAGGYGQLGGLTVACAQVVRRNNTPHTRQSLALALNLLEKIGINAQENDVISGLAGGILAAVSTLDVAPHEQVQRTVAALSSALVNRAVITDNQAHWIDGETGRGLTGFSHGTAGIALALTHAGVLLNDDALLELARQALAYDDTSFDATTGDWADLRSQPNEGPAMRAWCHGAPGGLLARSEIHRIAPSVLPHRWESMKRNALAALVETLEVSAPEAVNDSLCHGMIGNAVILQTLIDAGAVDETLQKVVDDALGKIIDTAHHFGWRTGALRGAPIPDALMGLSGIAWGLAVLGSTERTGLNLLTLSSWPTRKDAVL